MDILKIFDVCPLASGAVIPLLILSPCKQYTDKKTVEDIQYISFLLMARAGIRALEFYDPTTKKHGQAHMQAR